MDSQRNTEYQQLQMEDQTKVREILGDLMDEYSRENQEIKEHEVNELGGGECCLLVLFNFLFLICIFPLCSGFYTVEPLQAVVIMFLGKVIKVTKTPGLKWFWPIGREVKTVSLGNPSISLSFYYRSLAFVCLGVVTLRLEHDPPVGVLGAGQKRVSDERVCSDHLPSGQPDGLPVQRGPPRELHQGSGARGGQENHVQVRLHEQRPWSPHSSRRHRHHRYADILILNINNTRVPFETPKKLINLIN